VGFILWWGFFAGSGWVGGGVPVFDTQSADSQAEQNHVLWKGKSSWEEQPEFMISF